MSHSAFPFKEEVLHHIWANQLFASQGLCTSEGQKVEILSPGVLNRTDGPDFLGAKIRMGEIVHIGAVELHIKSRDWYAHDHHLDKNYEKVMLHVVADSGKVRPVQTSSGTTIPTLNLIHAVSENFSTLVNAGSPAFLPCSPVVPFISEDAFKAQVAKAHTEYLEKKVQDFYGFYDQSAVLSTAWKQALIIHLFDGFGVPHNREQMKQAGRLYLSTISNLEFDKQQFISETIAAVSWNKKSVHPGSRAVVRLPQLVEMAECIRQYSLDFFLESAPAEVWETLLNASSMRNTVHTQRMYVAFLLPAMYALATLVGSRKKMAFVFEEWQQSKVEIPASVLKKFGIFESVISLEKMKRMGLVHQLNSYCKPKQCIRCKVLNNAISS